MMDARNEIRLKAQLENIACRRESMIVANRLAKLRQEYPEYNQDDFERLAAEAQSVENLAVEC